MNSRREGCGLPHMFVCQECGKIVHLNHFIDDTSRHKMKQQQRCFECIYWLELIANPLPHSQIIDHQYFCFPPSINNVGKERYILTFDGHVIVSTQLFNYGHIPERFWKRLPNTANFLPFSRYKTIKANEGFECARVGCWDRTHCLWFHGPMDWNEIPASHKIGNEKCPMFINLLNPKK